MDVEYKYPLIDREGLLFLLTQLFRDMDASKVTIDTAISDGSTNEHVPGTKAVYDYVKAAIADIDHFSAVIVDTLPETGVSNRMYLVPRIKTEEKNIYDEWMYIDNKWERIGSTEIDLSGYVQYTDIYILQNSDIQELINEAKGKKGETTT